MTVLFIRVVLSDNNSNTDFVLVVLIHFRLIKPFDWSTFEE